MKMKNYFKLLQDDVMIISPYIKECVSKVQFKILSIYSLLTLFHIPRIVRETHQNIFNFLDPLKVTFS